MKIVIRILLSMAFITTFTINSLLAQDSNDDYWHIHIAIGSSYNFYPDKLQEILDDLPSEGIPFSGDAGIYLPISKLSTLLGIAITSSSDYYENNNAINHTFYAISIIHYPLSKLWKRVYLRGDVGISSITVPFIFDDNSDQVGNGLLLGGGYSWKLIGRSRLDVESYWINEPGNYSTVAFNVGIMLPNEISIPSIPLGR